MLLLILLALCQAKLVRVTTEYTRPYQGWVTIDLQHAVERLKGIEWCGSPEAISKDGPIVNLEECNAPRLMHRTLYPMQRGNKDDIDGISVQGMYLMIDPAKIGGWDTRHPADIIVKAEIAKGDTLVHIVKFNAPITSSSSSSSSSTTTKETTTSSSTTTSSASTETVTTVPVSTTASPMIIDLRNSLIVFGAGLVCIGLVTTYLYRRGRKFINAPYQFNEIEMTEYTTREDNLKRVLKMGTGASEIFFENTNLPQ